MNISGVYAIWCNGNQKIYIGSSVDILKRINQHKRELRTGKHHNPILQRSWNKYGENSFAFREVLQTPTEYAYRAEQEILDALKLVNHENVMNVLPKTTSLCRIGVRHSEDTKLKIGNANRGNKWDNESKQRMSLQRIGNQYRLGIKHSEEVKKRISETSKKKRASEESKKRMRIA